MANVHRDLNPLICAEQAATAGVARVGGKAQQLGYLQHYGLPVADFFIISASWRQQVFTLEALSVHVANELTRRNWLEIPLAVRSSAAGEDAATASFAGIYRSCLNVRGLDAVMSAIQAVWASLDTPQATAYRTGLNLPVEAAMAVIIMPLLPAKVSGIAFTCDPISGREDRMVIQAHVGLGESLVAGNASGDEYILTEDDTDTWRVHTYRIGSKAQMSIANADGGTNCVPTPSTLATQAALNHAQVEILAALLWDAALALDFVAPFYDFEWVWDGSQFWLTQARLITRKPRCTYPELQAQPAIWTRGNTCEVMPEPLSPMDWAFSRRAVNHLLEPGLRLSGFTLWPGIQRAGLFNGRLYLEASMMQWEVWDAIGLAPEQFNAMLGGHHPAIKTTPPTSVQRIKRIVNTLRYVVRAPAMRRRGKAEIAKLTQLAHEIDQCPADMDEHELEKLFLKLLPLSHQAEGLYFLQGSGGGSLSLMLDTLKRFYPNEAEAIGAALLANETDEPSQTAEQGYALLELAQLAKPFLGANGETNTLMHQPTFVAALNEFLYHYGHRGHYETYLRSPRWKDNPELLLAQLPALSKIDRKIIRQRQQQAANDAWQRIRHNMPAWARLLLSKQVKDARRDSNLREAARSALVKLGATARRLWLISGNLLVTRGFLKNPEDVFLLFPAEVQRAVINGEISAAGILARVEQRAVRFAQWKSTTPVEWHTLGGGDMTPAALPAHTRPHTRNGWHGVATGTGVARGKVRRLTHPAQGITLLPGEILVAPSTDPGWTPLFLKAGGLVVETGGYLSHGAIVAREFALPTVVNLPGIMENLCDGEWLEVDGRQGIVRRVPSE